MLARKKSNFARRGETIEVRWRDGVFRADTPATGIIASIERKSCDRVFVDLLRKTTGEGRYVSENAKAGNYAPRIFAQRPDRERFTKADFQRAMERLFAEGAISVGSYRGDDRKHRACIIASAEGAGGAGGSS